MVISLSARRQISSKVVFSLDRLESYGKTNPVVSLLLHKTKPCHRHTKNRKAFFEVRAQNKNFFVFPSSQKVSP